jgi:hypothetical protein
MNETSDTLVFWILVPLFLAAGLYLIWFAQRRKKMLATFASSHQLSFKQDYEENLQKRLDKCFALNKKNLVRSFDQLSSIIDGGPVLLFRAIELLDLNPHAQSDSTHFTRIIALFDITVEHDEFFILGKSMQIMKILPGSDTPNPVITKMLKQIVKSCNARHSLSITIRRGQGLIYFQPLVTGGETINDINSLFCIAKSIHEEFSGKR